MTAKEYLSQLQKLDKHIEQKLHEKTQYQNNITTVKALDYSTDRVQTSPKHEASYVELLIKLNDMSKQIDNEIDKFVDLKSKITKQIQMITDIRYSEILYNRYVKYMAFRKIAYEMNYSYAHVRKLHSFALCEFQKIMKDDTQ